MHLKVEVLPQNTKGGVEVVGGGAGVFQCRVCTELICCES